MTDRERYFNRQKSIKTVIQRMEYEHFPREILENPCDCCLCSVTPLKSMCKNCGEPSYDQEGNLLNNFSHFLGNPALLSNTEQVL